MYRHFFCVRQLKISLKKEDVSIYSLKTLIVDTQKGVNSNALFVVSIDFVAYVGAIVTVFGERFTTRTEQLTTLKK